MGVQAFLAIKDALKAVVYAQGEWCPDIEDVDMLIALAARADPGFEFRPAIEGDVYSQYSLARRDLPTELPLSSVMNHREMLEKDLRARCWTGWMWSGSRGNEIVRQRHPTEGTIEKRFFGSTPVIDDTVLPEHLVRSTNGGMEQGKKTVISVLREALH